MSEVGDFDIMGPAGVSEGSEVSQEVFREQMRKAQAARQQLKKEEGKARDQDQKLAAILVQFLSQPQNTDLFLLISRVVAQNIPSELIMAVIALVDQGATDEVKAYLASGDAGASTALAIQQKADFKSLPPEHKHMIDQWISNMHHVSAKKPQRILESVVSNFKASEYNENAMREISPVLIQLSSFILRNYLHYFKIEFEFDQIHAFMQAVFVELIKNLEGLVQGQKQLGGANDSA